MKAAAPSRCEALRRLKSADLKSRCETKRCLVSWDYRIRSPAGAADNGISRAPMQMSSERIFVKMSAWLLSAAALDAPEVTAEFLRKRERLGTGRRIWINCISIKTRTRKNKNCKIPHWGTVSPVSTWTWLSHSTQYPDSSTCSDVVPQCSD